MKKIHITIINIYFKWLRQCNKNNNKIPTLNNKLNLSNFEQKN